MTQQQQLEFGNLPPRRPLLRVLRESPAARVMQAGVKNVSLLELIGSITGDADVALRLLTQYPTLSDLVRAPIADLGLVHGLGPSKVAALQAAFELGRRAHFGTPADRRQIRSPSDAADLMLGEMSLLEQEEMRVMILDTRNRIVTVETLYRGNVNSSIVRTAEVFREAIRRNAPTVIVFHNHPSGDPEPSPEDVSVTRAIIQAGQLLDVSVLDHIVVGNRWVSLKERGLAFTN
jgi:DNA repair protein RadC